MSSIRHYASLIALVAAGAVPAHSQQDADDGETIIVTASRSGDGVSISRLGASASVVDARAIEQRQTRAVSDILRDVPGVAVNRSIGGVTQIRLRGAEANHALVLIDGMEVSDPYQGEFDLSGLMAEPGARLEVLRGQQSSLYGSDAIGGVVHYITATGAQEPGIHLRADGGSHGGFSGAARLAGTGGNLDYTLSGSYGRTDGTPTARGGTRDIGSRAGAVAGRLIWSPSEGFSLTGIARYNRLEADSNDTDNDPASPSFGFIVDSPGVHFTSEAFYGLVRAEVTAMDGHWTSALSAQVADTSRRRYNAAGLDFGNDGRRYKGSFETSFRFVTGPMLHRLTGAVDAEREEYRTVSPSPFAFGGQRHSDTLGIVGQYELIADAFSFGASLRRDENNRFDDATTWRAQASYVLPTGTRLRAAYGTGVKNPGYFELYGYSDGRYIGNPDLRPEKSKGWEAGIEQSFAANRATIGATWFESRLEGEIFTDYPPPDWIATPANRTTLSRQRGLEVFAHAQPIPEIRLDASYTYTRSRENGVAEVRRPRHVGSFNATVLSPDQSFSGTLTLRYNGRQLDDAYIDPSYVPVRLVLRDYVLVNLSAEYRLAPGMSLFGRVENLTDEAYEEVFSHASPSRTAHGGVRLRF